MCMLTRCKRQMDFVSDDKRLPQSLQRKIIIMVLTVCACAVTYFGCASQHQTLNRLFARRFVYVDYFKGARR